MLLESWLVMEKSAGPAGDSASVDRKMPKRVKRKRPITADDGTPAGYDWRKSTTLFTYIYDVVLCLIAWFLFCCWNRFEEYFDYIFPDESGSGPNLKILEAAYRWKRQKQSAAED